MRYILVIEDNRIVGMNMEWFLQSFGFSVLLRRSKQEAVKDLEMPFDVILFDYLDSGNVSAANFVARVRNHPINLETPLVVTSAWEYLPETLDIQGFVQKPFDLNVLRHSITEAISQSSERCSSNE